jgi:peptidoglycan/xylan/chitin deacetylase (PgdA/CDA1 family)
VSRRLLLAVVLLTSSGAGMLTAATGAAGRPRPGPSPAGLAGVRAASLRQRGRRLVWRVALTHPFSAAGLRSNRRSVCLLLERRGSGAPDGRLCLEATRGRRGLGLEFATVRGSHAGQSRRVAGRVRREGGQVVLVSFAPTALRRRWAPLRWQTLSTVQARSCPTANARRATCTVRFPAHRHPLARLHVPRLVGCVARGPAVVYGGSSSRREVALTFDDGPWNDPPSIDFVNELHRLGAPATFFEIGDQIHEFDPTGAIERTMLADGDMIGNHTWTHPDMETLSPAAQSTELTLTQHAIRSATGFTPCLWRPPYGSVDSGLESLARGLGLLTIYWNDDPRDWSLPGTAAIVQTALQEARNGSIIEMHFGGGPREETLAAIPEIVHALRARGDRLVNLAQMLGVREIWR